MTTYTGAAFVTKFAAYLIYKGATTAAALNLAQPKIGFVYDLTEGGTLNNGSLTVLAGDAVMYLAQGWTVCNNNGATAAIVELQQQFEDLQEEIGGTDFSKFALKTDIPTVPTKTSDLTNDSGFLTQHQSLENYALKTEIPDVSDYATFENIPTKVSQLENDENYLTDAVVADRVRKVENLSDEQGNVGEIIQYVGETTENYKNGFFYKCINSQGLPDTITNGDITYTKSENENKELVIGTITDLNGDISTAGTIFNLFYCIGSATWVTVDFQSFSNSQRTAFDSENETITIYTRNGNVEFQISDMQIVRSNFTFKNGNEKLYIFATPYNGWEKKFVAFSSDYNIAPQPISYENVAVWKQHNTQPEISVPLTDNFLSISNNVLGAKISIGYNSQNHHLELKGLNDTVVDFVDMTQFLKDGMLDNVEYFTTAETGILTETPYLKFTFNTDAEKSVIRISLNDLVNIYNGANVNLTNAFAKAVTYSEPASGDSVDVAIGKLTKGISDNQTAIAQKANIQSAATNPATSVVCTSTAIKAYGAMHAGRYGQDDQQGVNAFQVGNGIDSQNKSNIHELTWNGTSWTKQDVTSGGTAANPAHRLSNKVNGICISESAFEVLQSYQSGFLYFVYED